MSYMVEIINLVKKFGNIVAVNGLNLEINKGEIFALLGPNGAGKTTTVRMIMGLLKPTRGKIFVDGIDISRNLSEAKKRIGYVPQFFSLYEDLTVLENLYFFGKIYDLPKNVINERIRELLEAVDLREHKDKLAGNLSGGLKRRLSFAVALLHDPKLLILDEPTAGIDPPLRRAFWKMFKALRNEGKTILVTTHYMDETEHADRIGLISRGQLVAIGTPAEIKRKVFDGDLIRIVFRGGKILTKLNAPWLVRLLRRENTANGEQEVVLIVKELASVLPKIPIVLKKLGFEPILIEPVSVTLEDAFIALTSGGEINVGEIIRGYW